MKISWNWLREFVATGIGVEQAAHLLTDIGLEVEAVEPYATVRGGLEGLVVAQVVDLASHPNADKLKVAKVNAGQGDLLQIVCGAPNIEKGQKVILAPVGVTVHPITGEPFTIRKAKIRGTESEGMLCADDEIGLGESHEGLHILPDSAEIGKPVKELFEMYSDTVIEIGLTANHADANSHFGTARELTAALKARNIEDATFNDSVLKNNGQLNSKSKDAKNKIDVVVENANACPRYSGVLLENVTIAESPMWLQNKLKAIGLRPINNVVDITNYILHGFGQPLHAFDADAIKGNKVVVKTLREGTTFVTLDEKERKLSSHDLMICNAEEGMCIAGVYGGLHSGITTKTTRIFLESACFNPYFIRRTESKHGLKTDASSRFAKGTDPEMTVPALRIAVELMQQLCSAHINGEIIDLYPAPVQPAQVHLRYHRLQQISATEIPKESILSILKALQIRVVKQTEEGLYLEIPPFKNDVLREIDVIEEVLRIYGYHHIPTPAGIRMPYLVNDEPDWDQKRSSIISWLAANGYYEIFTNSISKSRYHEKFLPTGLDNQVKLMNSLNTELDCMRQSMLFSGLEVIAFNHNRKQQRLRFFELGKTYFKNTGGYKEEEKLSLFITGNRHEEIWDQEQTPAGFFDLKEVVERLLERSNVQFEMKAAPLPLVDGVEIICQGKSMGYCGIVKPEICRDFDIRLPVLFAELDWQQMMISSEARNVVFTEIPKFPEVRRDLALLLQRSIHYSDVRQLAIRSGGSLLREIVLFDVYEDDKLEGKKSYAIGLTFRDEEKTLTDAEVDVVMQKMMRTFETELNAEIRK